ncbi:50S ribosomal protein L16 [Candidatus Woesearchaeota archaeon]|nr:50S ribosomal protein L16 [Candidatus Woesearchaeota archaeon]
MAKLRRAVAWRRLERPFTRTSKYKKLNYVRNIPNRKIVRYDMGNPKRKFSYYLDLVSKDDIQIRHNAIESARQSSNRVLELTLGKSAYQYKIRIFPHHVLRENPLAAGAGADRMSTGMKKSYGKSVGSAARVKKGQVLFTVGVQKPHIETARKALVRAKNKLPCSCSIQVREIKESK